MIRLSIIICTCNRSQLVSKLIGCFDELIGVPDNLKYEIIIVDNNSRDDTQAVVSGLLGKNRNYKLRCILERTPGLSNARNRGIIESSYEFLNFLDDDVLPEKDYLVAVASAMAANPEIKCFSPAILYEPVNRPSWYTASGKYAMLNRGGFYIGDSSRLLGDNEFPIGAAMIIAKELFVRYGKFENRFGYDVTKSVLIPGEESEFYFKLKAERVPIYYIHNAIAKHKQDKDKFDMKTLVKTYKGIGYWYGSADVRNLKNKCIVIWGPYPRSYYKRAIKTGLKYLLSRFNWNRTIRNYYRFQIEETIGYFMGYKYFRSKGRTFN
jgi:glycosyltransferase involved in cell wall biosynthesis